MQAVGQISNCSLEYMGTLFTRVLLHTQVYTFVNLFTCVFVSWKHSFLIYKFKFVILLVPKPGS